MAPPYTKTLFIELVRFTPGQPDHVGPPLPPVSRQTGLVPSPAVSRAPPPPHSHHAHSPHMSMSHPHSNGIEHSRALVSSTSTRNVLPPPPWSKGFAPPLPRVPVASSSSSGTPHLHPAAYPLQGIPPSPGSSRKRKSPPPEDTIASKRRSAPVTPVLHHEAPHLAPVIGRVHDPAVENRPRMVSDPRPVIHSRTPDMRSRGVPMDEGHSPYAMDPRMIPSPHYAPREIDPRHQVPPIPRGYVQVHPSTSRSERVDYPPPRMSHPSEVEARRRSGSFSRSVLLNSKRLQWG
jgi:histone demethylase JARID1